MAANEKGLHQAQDFARLAGVTVRTLHHYDRLGLLKPERYTEAGYRLYGQASLARLQQISILKFIGMPLKQIRDALGRNSLDLRTTLRLQREVIESRRRQLDSALSAIERAERIVATADDSESNWDAFRKIIEVVNMQNNKEWINKYYSEEARQKIASNPMSPEQIEQSQHEWAALIREVEDSLGEDPAGPKAQALAERWAGLINQFTMGDPGVQEGLKKLYSDQQNWPSTFKKPYSDEVGEFIARALSARPRQS